MNLEHRKKGNKEAETFKAAQVGLRTVSETKLRGLVRRLWHSPTVTGWSSFSITAANFVVLMPLAIKHLTPGDFALWLLFGTVANMQSFLTLGLTPTFTRMVAYAMAGRRVSELPANVQLARPSGVPNGDTLRRVAGTTHRLFALAAVIAVLLGLSAGSSLIARPISLSSHPSASWVAWSILLAGTVANLASTGVNCFLMGMNHVALLQRWQTMFGVTGILASAAVLALGGSLVGLVICGQLFVGATIIRNLVLCRRVPWGGDAVTLGAGFDTGVWAAAWPASWRNGLSSVFYLGFVQVSGLIYAQFAGAVAVASYVFCLRVVQVVGTFSQAPFFSRIPEMARMYGAGEKERLLTLARRCMVRAYWTFALGATLLLLGGNFVLNFIAPGKYRLDPWLLALLVLAIFFERVSSMNYQLAHVTNRIYSHIGAAGVLAINLAICYLLGPHLGVKAFALGLLAGQMLFQAWYASGKAGRLLAFDSYRFNFRTAIVPFAAVAAAAILEVTKLA